MLTKVQSLLAGQNDGSENPTHALLTLLTPVFIKEYLFMLTRYNQSAHHQRKDSPGMLLLMVCNSLTRTRYEFIRYSTNMFTLLYSDHYHCSMKIINTYGNIKHSLLHTNSD